MSYDKIEIGFFGKILNGTIKERIIFIAVFCLISFGVSMLISSLAVKQNSTASFEVERQEYISKKKSVEADISAKQKDFESIKQYKQLKSREYKITQFDLMVGKDIAPGHYKINVESTYTNPSMEFFHIKDTVTNGFSVEGKGPFTNRKYPVDETILKAGLLINAKPFASAECNEIITLTPIEE